MNQHDQMREALITIITGLNWIVTHPNEPDAIVVWGREIIKYAEQALAAEPAPLVRLNDDALVNIYLECKAEWKATNKRQRQRIAVLFGRAIMTAMERANK